MDKPYLSQNSSSINQVPLLSPDTEILLKRYLKMQIASMYWGAITKILIFIVVVGSAIFSTLQLAPFVEQQLKLLQNLRPTLESFPTENR